MNATGSQPPVQQGCWQELLPPSNGFRTSFLDGERMLMLVQAARSGRGRWASSRGCLCSVGCALE